MQDKLVPILLGKTQTARKMLKTEPDGMAWDWVSNTCCIRKAGVDTLGTANQFLTVTGVLTSSVDGATFNSSNFATMTFASQSIPTAGYIVNCTMYSEFRPDTVNAALHVAFDFSDGTTNNFNRIVGSSSANVSAFNSTSATVAQYNIQHVGTPVQGTWYRVSGGYVTNNAATSRDGAAILNDLVCVDPVGCNLITIGSRSGAGANNLGGNLRKIMFLPRRLTDADLVTLSVTGALP